MLSRIRRAPAESVGEDQFYDVSERLNSLHGREINHGSTRMNTDSIQREDAKAFAKLKTKMGAAPRTAWPIQRDTSSGNSGKTGGTHNSVRGSVSICPSV